MADRDTTPISISTANALLGAWSDFLTIALHTLLYHRGIYPRRTFLTARAFGAVVHQSRHPRVISWIRTAVEAVKEQIRTGAVERVVLVLYSPIPLAPTTPQPSVSIAIPTEPNGSVSTLKTPARKNTQRTPTSILKKPNTIATPRTGAQRTPAVAERWVFSTSMFPIFPVTAAPAAAAADFDAAEDTAEDVAEAVAEQINWVDIDEQLRAALQRISHAADKLQPLGEGATFTLAVEMREDAPAPVGHPQPWIPSEFNSQASGPINTTNTVPIRSVTAGLLFFECWIEQANSS
ncbi:hypothetical protein TD95_003475 [Thielaviopsis punctulata]|uniref:HORMA domain-containing protein n=1 Tax=Thielaviopsis punctulata TaxID=72032 RepID=A0A0F4Z9S2_9PEZI|nr:hypothetical protein TD95_003475 [Thielaviopsis punctulata]